MGLNDVNSNLEYFNDIYEKRESYSLRWAFEDAQQKVDELRAGCKKEGVCPKAVQKTSKQLKRGKLLCRLFSHIGALLTGLEMIVSVLLVLALTALSHSVDSMIQSEMLSVYFLVAIAFVKVIAESRFVRPQIENLGWLLYRRCYLWIGRAVAETAQSVPEETGRVYVGGLENESA